MAPMKKVHVKFGMDTHEVTVWPTGTVTERILTDMGSAQGGTWDTVDNYLDDMDEIGMGRSCRSTFEHAGIIQPRD